MTPRVAWIDATKGLLILLVILGHTITCKIGRNLINGFDMAAFFFLSGYLFSRDRPFFSTLKRKTMSLLLPYLCFSAIYLTYFWLKSALFHGEFDLAHGLASVVAPISGYWKSSVYGLWFLPCLYFVEVLTSAFCQINNRVIAVIAACFITIGIIISTVMTKVVSVLSLIPLAELFFALGVVAKKAVFRMKQNLTVAIIAVVLYCSLVAFNTAISDRMLMDFSSLAIGFPPVFVLHALAGTAFVLTVSKWLEKANWLIFVGKTSLYYYGIHYIVLSASSQLLGGKIGEIPTFVVTVLLSTLIVLAYLTLKKCIRSWFHDQRNCTNL